MLPEKPSVRAQRNRLRMTWLVLLLFVVLAGLVVGTLLLRKPALPVYPPAVDGPTLSIHALRSPDLPLGTYTTQGFVALVYHCPPCPPGAQCAPCMPDHIVLSESDQVLDTYLISTSEMIVYLVGSERFTTGDQLRVTLTALVHNRFEMVGYTLIQDAP